MDSTYLHGCMTNDTNVTIKDSTQGYLSAPTLSPIYLSLSLSALRFFRFLVGLLCHFLYYPLFSSSSSTSFSLSSFYSTYSSSSTFKVLSILIYCCLYHGVYIITNPIIVLMFFHPLFSFHPLIYFFYIAPFSSTSHF